MKILCFKILKKEIMYSTTYKTVNELQQELYCPYFKEVILFMRLQQKILNLPSGIYFFENILSKSIRFFSNIPQNSQTILPKKVIENT